VSLAAMLIEKVTLVPKSKAADGVKVMVVPLADHVNVPVTPAGAVTWKAVCAEARSIGSLNTTLILGRVATPVWPFAGVVEATVGGVVSGAAAVVNVNENAAARALPAASAAPVPTVTRYIVPA